MAGFPSDTQNRWGEGRETTNRSYRMRGAKRKALRKRNLEFTLKYLHHVEALSGGEAGARQRQTERASEQKRWQLEQRGKKKGNSKLRSCGLIKCRGGVYLAHPHRGAPSRQYAPAARFGSAQTGPATAPHASRTMDVRT